jgi:hypothetical protein
VSEQDTLLLKGIAADLIEPIWKAEFYNDAEESIEYLDPKEKTKPRPEVEIRKMMSELNRLKNDLIDEIVEEMLEKKIVTVEDLRRYYKEVQSTCHERFGDYRRRLWNVVEAGFPPE